MNVSAVVVTRGDVDLSEILESMPREWEKVVWDNSKRADLSVYGRYAAIADCEHDVIFVQDDDCVLAPWAFERLLDAYEPGAVVCNMPERFRHDFYREHALVGFGALFDRDLPKRAFNRLGIYDGDKQILRMGDPQIDIATFHRTCDVVFTALTARVLVDETYLDLPWASDPNRMWKQPTHVGERQRMLDLTLRVRDGAAA